MIKNLFYPGDIIIQKYQNNANPRLVLMQSDLSNDTVLVSCPDNGMIKVHTWSHRLIKSTKDIDRNVLDFRESHNKYLC
jgi:hypothetical protein